MKELRKVLDDWIQTRASLVKARELEAELLSGYEDGPITMFDIGGVQGRWYGYIKNGMFTKPVVDHALIDIDNAVYQLGNYALAEANMNRNLLQAKLNGIEYFMCQSVVDVMRPELRHVKNVHVLYGPYRWYIYTGRKAGNWTRPFMISTSFSDAVEIDADEGTMQLVKPFDDPALQKELEHRVIDGWKCYRIEIDEFPDLVVYDVPELGGHWVNIYEVDCENKKSLWTYNQSKGHGYGEVLIAVDIYIDWRNEYWVMHGLKQGDTGVTGAQGDTGGHSDADAGARFVRYDGYLGANIYTDPEKDDEYVFVSDLVDSYEEELQLRSFMVFRDLSQYVNYYPVEDCLAWRRMISG